MNLQAKVEKVINDWDPIRLFPEFPEDEYCDEIDMIVELLNKTDDLEEVAKGIKEIFLESFSAIVFRYSSEECLVISRQLLSKSYHK